MHGSFKKEAAMEVDFSQIMMLQFFHMKVIYTRAGTVLHQP